MDKLNLASLVFCLIPWKGLGITEESPFVILSLSNFFSLKSCHLCSHSSSQLRPCHQVGNFNFHVNEFSSTVTSQFLDFYTSSHTSTCTFPSLELFCPEIWKAPLIITFYHQALNLLNFRGDPLDCFLLFYPPFLCFPSLLQSA